MEQETPTRSATPVLDSPKEDGEVGETLGDIVRRHQLDITPEVEHLYSAMHTGYEFMGPDTASNSARLLSAILSPMPHKATPADAKQALRCITHYVLPQRRRTRAEEKAFQMALDAELARAVAEKMEEERAERRERKRALRSKPSPKALRRKERNNYGILGTP